MLTDCQHLQFGDILTVRQHIFVLLGAALITNDRNLNL